MATLLLSLLLGLSSNFNPNKLMKRFRKQSESFKSSAQAHHSQLSKMSESKSVPDKRGKFEETLVKSTGMNLRRSKFATSSMPEKVAESFSASKAKVFQPKLLATPTKVLVPCEKEHEDEEEERVKPASSS